MPRLTKVIFNKSKPDPNIRLWLKARGLKSTAPIKRENGKKVVNLTYNKFKTIEKKIIFKNGVEGILHMKIIKEQYRDAMKAKTKKANKSKK